MKRIHSVFPGLVACSKFERILKNFTVFPTHKNIICILLFIVHRAGKTFSWITPKLFSFIMEDNLPKRMDGTDIFKLVFNDDVVWCTWWKEQLLMG